eukprot:TRINITY_DN1612_c0_g1_i18.p1 TRINITY_DN1612_c0_g1~~TRINITY_DN1612_c0_g1_i18.p1  ORF type:complete len:562 (-),score=105.26 TRINITY_DN1612_c0_g1_i18:2784-4469(-)
MIMQQLPQELYTFNCQETCQSPSSASQSEETYNKTDELLDSRGPLDSKQQDQFPDSDSMVDLQSMIQRMVLENNNMNMKYENSRELFLANADVNQDDLRGLLQQCGQVKSLTKPTDMQHIWCVVYFDVRAAQAAMASFQGKSIDGIQAPLEIVSQAPWADKEGLGEDCIIVANIDPSTPADSINMIFGKFGDIVGSIPLPNNRRAIQFFDVRSVDAAYNQLVGSGVVSKPVQPVQQFNNVGLASHDSVSSFGSIAQPTGFGGLPFSTGLPFANAPGMDVSQLMSSFPQLGMMGAGQNMPLDSLNKFGMGSVSTPTLASLAYPSVSGGQALASLAQSSPGVGNANNTPQLAQILAAAQAQALINAAQGILKSASLGSLDLASLAQQSNEAQRKADMVKKYSLDVEKIKNGEDQRTTLMIKNIPNKYTPQMILDTINDAGIKGCYDFLYLPLDFRNRCNVGYAFINMRNSVTDVPLLFNEFNGRRWERFNSEKVSQVTYARIQGREQLVNHFQNSSLMLEDEACRPMLFSDQGDIQKFPVGPDVQPRIVEDRVSESSSIKQEE